MRLPLPFRFQWKPKRVVPSRDVHIHTETGLFPVEFVYDHFCREDWAHQWEGHAVGWDGSCPTKVCNMESMLSGGGNAVNMTLDASLVMDL